jgi:hypothetical protein
MDGHRLSPSQCGNYKKQVPFPRIDILFDQLSKAKVFSNIDVRSGTIRLESSPKTL